MPDRINRVTSSAVEAATGKSWSAWLKLIDRAGGRKLSHGEIVALAKHA